MTEKEFRSGFVSIIGRPNVGKSTLLNSILGEKIVITSDKPQTTRNRIKGIHNFPGGQIVFIDTPGIHDPRSRLNRFMVEQALSAVKEVDVILFLVEAGASVGKQEEMILQALEKVRTPVILVVNKIDRAEQAVAQATLDAYAGRYPFRGTVALSAMTGYGVEQLAGAVAGLLPEGPAYFPDDILTDVPERFVVAEIIREKVFHLTRDEIPYSVAVTVDSFKERPDGSLISIAATITVERDSQKGIVIGRRGELLKKIGSQARREIEDLLQTKVFLELFVRVRRDWSENEMMLKELGYK